MSPGEFETAFYQKSTVLMIYHEHTHPTVNRHFRETHAFAPQMVHLLPEQRIRRHQHFRQQPCQHRYASDVVHQPSNQGFQQQHHCHCRGNHRHSLHYRVRRRFHTNRIVPASLAPRRNASQFFQQGRRVTLTTVRSSAASGLCPLFLRLNSQWRFT